METFQHFSHIHSLVLTSWNSEPIWNCNLCGHPITDQQSYYRCLSCLYYFIHETCAELPQRIDNSLHDQHPLILLKTPSHESNISCRYCEKSFSDENAYTCKECSFYMHIACAFIPLPTISRHGDEDGASVQFSCHGQPMILGDSKDVKDNNTCFGCQSPWSSPAYACTTCENFLHKGCAEQSLEIRHPFHRHNSLTLEVSKPQSCDLCFKNDCRLIYNCCEVGCSFKIGIECSSLDTIINCQSHDHLLCLVEKASSDNIVCDACQKSYKEWNDHNARNDEVYCTRSFLFRCMECDFNLHFLCGALPFSLKYEYHIHNLTLVDSLRYGTFSSEYYCDICEKERHPQFRVYNCADCQYVGHIHCLIPEIMKVLKRGTNAVNPTELRIFGESRWNWGIESMENAKEESMTLKNIMDSLSNQEMEIINPKGINYKLGEYIYMRKLHSRFDQLESIEDFGRITEFLKSKFPDLLVSFWKEICSYTHEEGLEVEEKYSRQKVVEVEGKYKVPKTLAPILKTLIHKDGDLGGYPYLTPGVRSFTTTILLILIDKMCRNNVEDIRLDDLKKWHYYLSTIQKTTGFKVRKYVDGLYSVLRVYLGLKAIKCEEKASEQLDLKIASLEAELERCKRNREELKMCAPRKSYFFFKMALIQKDKTVADIMWV